MKWLLCVALAFLVACGPAPRELAAQTPAGPSVPDSTPMPVPREQVKESMALVDCGTVLTAADVEKVCGVPVTMEAGITETQSGGQPAPFFCDRKFDAGEKHAAMVIDGYPDAATGKGVWGVLYGKKTSAMTSFETLNIGDAASKYTQDFGAGTSEVVTAVKGSWRVALVTTTVEGRTAPLCNAAQMQELVALVIGRV
ncbi:hypothetical protein HY642_06810 [Candidatus Woesearchaeota archaeon]|nr:hypothetical protein [Candidatus Woesearchaeota archaeon]